MYLVLQSQTAVLSKLLYTAQTCKDMIGGIVTRTDLEKPPSQVCQCYGGVIISQSEYEIKY